MDESTQAVRRTLYIVAGIFLVLLLMRIPIFGRVLLMLAGVALIGAAAYFMVIWLKRIRERKADKAFRKTREGQIRTKMEECDRLIARNEQEMVEIKRNLNELHTRINLPNLSAKQREDTQELKTAFQSEWDLRRTKAQFFDSCRKKLKQMEQHFRLERELALKKDSLRRLQENNFEELAEFEGLKAELELNSYYLETIEELSSRMQLSTTVSDAKHLQLELEQMTRDIDEG